MRKTIILFQPKFWPGPLLNEKPRYEKYYHGVRETFRYLPLGLLYIAALLKERYEVIIVDERFDEGWQERVTGMLAEKDVLFAGVTSCTGYEIRGGLEFSRLVKEIAPGVPVVWGGWHASTVPEDTVKSPSVDVVVRGQGEWTVLELAERLEAGSADFQGIKGLTYISDEGNVVNEPDRELRPADDLPDLDFSLVDVERYLHFKDGTPARLFYMSSLGCPFNCAFCSIAAVYGRHWSSKDPARVVRDLRYFVDNYGIKAVEFDGTIFFANPKWSKSMLKALIESGMELEYITSTRADLILKWDDEMKDLVKRSGFKAIGVGAESGSPRMLDKIAKNINVEDIPDSLEVLKELGIDPCYTFMFNLPGETMADAQMTLRLMVRLKKIMPECRVAGFFYHPFPGSKTYLEYKQLHNLPDLSLEEWADYSFDLKFTESLAIDKTYRDFIRQRLQYLYWAYPEDDTHHGVFRKLASRVARLRVMHEFYFLPLEWYLAKSLGKVVY